MNSRYPVAGDDLVLGDNASLGNCRSLRSSEGSWLRFIAAVETKALPVAWRTSPK